MQNTSSCQGPRRRERTFPIAPGRGTPFEGHQAAPQRGTKHGDGQSRHRVSLHFVAPPGGLQRCAATRRFGTRLLATKNKQITFQKQRLCKSRIRFCMTNTIGPLVSAVSRPGGSLRATASRSRVRTRTNCAASGHALQLQRQRPYERSQRHRRASAHTSARSATAEPAGLCHATYLTEGASGSGCKSLKTWDGNVTMRPGANGCA